MLKAAPISWFSWNYELSEGGQRVGTISTAWVRERAAMSVRGMTCELYRESMWGRFLATVNGEIIASADKPSAFHRRFIIQFEDREIESVAESPLGRSFILREHGHDIGAIRPLHVFTRKAMIDLPDDFPIEISVFTFWLVVLMWRRQANNSAT